MFRDTDETYKMLRADFMLSFNATYQPGTGINVLELDRLMMASYRLKRHIREHLKSQQVDVSSTESKEAPLLFDACKAVLNIMGKKNGVIGLFNEAEKVEALSRSAYRWLKENDKLVDNV